MNFRYPVFMDVSGKRCVVVGEGYEVPMKVQGLVDAQADVLYLNKTADPRIASLAEAGALRWERREFREEDLLDSFLVISDQEDNSEIFQQCEAARVLCNSVDDPEHCRFSFGSVHRQGELTIAISTNGWAPAVAVRLKQKLQGEVGAEYATFLAMLRTVRPEITAGISDFGRRRELWYRIVDSEILSMVREGRQDEAHTMLWRFIDEARADQ